MPQLGRQIVLYRLLRYFVSGSAGYQLPRSYAGAHVCRRAFRTAGRTAAHSHWDIGTAGNAFHFANNEIYPLFSLEAANAYHVHNLFLQEFIELGIVGFSVFLALVLLFFQKIYSTMARAARRYRFILAAVFGGFAGILLQGMTDHIWFDYSIVLLFWCVLGIGMAAVRLGEKSWRKKN